MLTNVFLFGLLALLPETKAYRILVSFPMVSRSHSILGHGVVNNLLEAGHEVVHLTSFPKEKPVRNLMEINMTDAYEEMLKDTINNEDFKLKNFIGKGNIGDSAFFLYFTHKLHKHMLLHEKLQSILTDPGEKFDAVIIEWFFHDAVAGIAPLLQAPLIWFGSTEAHWQILKLVDEIPNPAYAVDIFSTNSPPMTTWERITELYTVVKRSIIWNCLVVLLERNLYNGLIADLAYRRGVTIPSYEDAVYNASLLLLNSHPSLGTPHKLPQSAKYIGGYHISNDPKPLPENLLNILDGSQHGAIYFSMGSNLKSSDMSDHMRDSLLKMFGRLKQTVIWKFEEDFDNVPSNVHLIKWAPQQNVLAHPQLKIFITHGGQLSTTEAVYHGVPLIGLPVMADQHVNMKSVVKKGFGIYVDIAGNVAEDIHLAVQKILSNSSYKEKAMELSQIYHDRPMTPGQELVYWVEHVVRTRGATHLRSPALQVPWHKKMYLDVAAICIVVLAILAWLVKGVRKIMAENAEKVKTS